MGIFGWRRHLGARGTTFYRPTSGLFPELDLEQMAGRMRLAKLGAQRGRLNQPSAHSDSFDEIENRIVTVIESEKRRAFDEVSSHLRTIRERVAALQLDSVIGKVRVTVDAAVADLAAATRSGRDRLYALKTAVVENETTFRRFQRQHRLQRPPQFPQSRVLHVGILVALALVESAANAFLIALGHERGLLGGLVNAVVISALNVGGGVFAGLALVRYLFHCSMVRQLLSAVGCCVYVVFVLTSNLLVAHYRDAFEATGGERAAARALDSLMENPFQLQDVSGWFLFLMGCAFAGIAAYDGFRLDDTYPGYGRVARLAEEAKRDYIAEKESVLSTVVAIRDAGMRAADELVADIDVRRAHYESLIAEKRRLLESYEQHLRYVEQCANDLLSIYRDANRGARTNEPPPHFSHRYNSVQRPPVRRISDVLAETPGGVTDVRRALNDIVDEHGRKLRHEYQSALAAFELVEDLDRGVTGT
jgi:hypothetical protein